MLPRVDLLCTHWYFLPDDCQKPIMDSSTSSTPFTIDNIPFGVISTPDSPVPRCATAFEDHAVDLSCLESDGAFASISGFGNGVFSQVSFHLYFFLI